MKAVFKEQMFKDDLMELFDFATKNALDIITNSEDRQILTMQGEDPPVQV